LEVIMKGNVFFLLVIILALILSTPAAAIEFDLLHCSPGGNHWAVSLSDWDGDGDMEVVAGNWNGNRAEVWDYDHMLGDMVLIESVSLAYNPWDVDAADLDHDGDMDIVAGIRFYGTYAHLNQGTGWTTVHVDPIYCYLVEIADFDGDSHPDIYSGVDYNHSRLFYGDGTGNFANGPAPSPEYPYGTSMLNVVDFNSDGRPDLLGSVGHYYHPYVYVRAYPNLSTPGSPAWGASVGPPEGHSKTGWVSFTPSVADFDGNGYTDYVFVMDGDLCVLWGDGDGVSLWWTKAIVDNYSELYNSAYAGDLNQDGNPDIVVGGYYGMYEGLRFYFSDGAGGFTYEEYPMDHGLTHRNGLKLGDINGDGLTDIVAMRWPYSNDGFDVLLQTHKTVALDIKPGSCPNPLNVKSRGVLPVAILGTADLDVEQIDTASIRLEGVAPIQSSFQDVAAPFEPYTGKEDCEFDCNDWGPDGWTDLTLKFNTQDIVSTLGDNQDGECAVLSIIGNLKEEYGGTPFEGEDVVKVLHRGGSGKRSLDSRLQDRGTRLPGPQEEETPEEFQPRR
jgi:hypothetical protein